MGCDVNDANRDATQDPEYNLERLHTPPSDEWYLGECKLPDGSPCPYRETCTECKRLGDPADNTYHPRTEPLMHEYEPQDLAYHDPLGSEDEADRTVAREPYMPAYLPNVNSTLPDPAYPAPEPDNFHIMTYGVIGDVTFSDDPTKSDPQRQNGLTSFSVRDEYDDLIHTDFHTFNPLSLLNESNVWNGKRVRVDIQDYKNVIEWFVYNYPMELVWYDSAHPENSLIIPHPSDGVYKDHVDPDSTGWQDYTDSDAFKKFLEEMLKTEENAQMKEWWQSLIDQQKRPGRDPNYHGPLEDWEYEPGPGENFNGGTGYKELHRSFLEIGQMDGNKKISLFQFLTLIKQFFHLDDSWWILRNHELRITYQEFNTYQEDQERNTIVRKVIGDNRPAGTTDAYEWYNPERSNWMKDGHVAPEGQTYFVGNVENRQFSMRIDFRDSIHYAPDSYDTYFGSRAFKGSDTKGGREAAKLMHEGSIPKQFRPHSFQWIANYGLMYCQVGAWEFIVNYMMPVDIGIDTDGSVWLATSGLTCITPYSPHAGIYKPPVLGGDDGHYHYWSSTWADFQIDVYTFGGILTLGDSGDIW